jgi:hypothetical protein
MGCGWMRASEAREARAHGLVGSIGPRQAAPQEWLAKTNYPAFSTNSKAAQRQSWAISLSPTTVEGSGMHVQGIQRQ